MRTFRFRIYPSDAQIGILNSTLDLCREFYNAMLQQRIYAYRSGKKVNYFSQQNEIPGIKDILPEFRNIHSQVLQDVARRLDKAYDNFFRRMNAKKKGKNKKAGFPRFKPVDRYNSITYTQSGFRILDNGHVWLSKIGEVRMFMHRPINETIKTLSIKCDKVGDWFITITADEKENNQPFEQEDHGPIIKGVMKEDMEFRSPIGIDLGLKALIMTSNDHQIEPPAFLMKSEKKLKKAQRNLSRKKNGSKK